MGHELMLIARKDNFLIRALAKKLTDSDIECFFCPADIDDLSENKKRVALCAYYMNEGERIDDEILHYLKEMLLTENAKIALIGDKDDTEAALLALSDHLVLKRYPRPLETDRFVKDMKAYFKGSTSLHETGRILVVDDDTTYLTLIRDWLKDSYKVSMANSGLQAIKSLGMNPVDLVLLDYEMPVTSGPQVLEMLRSDVETARIPVIFLTGKSDKESVMQVVSLKPEGYLLKTIGKEQLLEKLSEFFATHQRK